MEKNEAGELAFVTLRVLGAGLLLAGTAAGHAISMSSGFATLTGDRVGYILRMPAYEVPQGKDPAVLLLDRIVFSAGFETARRVDGECALDGNTWLCGADYRFTKPVEKLTVECRFAEVTVPNHIHLLRAERGGKSDQAVLDAAFPSATLAFRPPTAFETAAAEAGSGAMRVWTNAAQVLLIVAIALAARTRREFAILTGVFLAGEAVGTFALLRTAWQPSLRFAEAAAALALAYLALETLAFPKSSGRWLLALIFGAFQSMFFALFVAQSGYSAAWVLSGAAAGALAIALACALLGLALRRWLGVVRVAADCALMAAGAIWFIVRLRS